GQDAEDRGRRRRRPDCRPADPAPADPREIRLDAALAVAVAAGLGIARNNPGQVPGFVFPAACPAGAQRPGSSFSDPVAGAARQAARPTVATLARLENSA